MLTAADLAVHTPAWTWSCFTIASARIELAIDAEVSDLTSDRGSGVPGRVTASIDSVVNLELGQSLVLAGLIAHSEASSRTRPAGLLARSRCSARCSARTAPRRAQRER